MVAISADFMTEPHFHPCIPTTQRDPTRGAEVDLDPPERLGRKGYVRLSCPSSIEALVPNIIM